MIFNQVATPLQFTPRKLLVHPPTGNLVLIETDHNAFTEATKAQRKQLMAEVCLKVTLLTTHTQCLPSLLSSTAGNGADGRRR